MNHAKLKVASYTLGCKVNSYETKAILESFDETKYELVDISDNADIYIINTCSVTNLSEKKSRQALRKAKKGNVNSIVVAVGCYSQIASEEISKIEEVDIVVGTNNKTKIVELVETYLSDKDKQKLVLNMDNDFFEYENLKLSDFRGQVRAYIKIQDGCDNVCTYCSIRIARGKVRSRSLESIYEETLILAQKSFKEIVLVGIHVASYGKDFKDVDVSLIDVLKKIHDIEGIERIRFSSVEPVLIKEKFIDEVRKLHKVCDFYHLSLQSGCDKTLNAMKRRYNTTQYKKSVELLRKAYPNLNLTTDVIVGFPDETEDDFNESLKFVDEMKFYDVHIFPFSKKKGTESFDMKNQLPENIKKQRAKKLAELSLKNQKDILQTYIGKEIEVLFESTEIIDNEKYFVGHTRNYMLVKVKTDDDLTNQIILVTAKEIIDDYILAI